MMTNWKLSAFVLAFAFACSDDIGPIGLPDEGVSLAALGGADEFSAAGSPTFDANGVVPSTFAVALEDSVGGMVIAAFDKHDNTGDLFILQFTQARTGDFGPCESAANCHGRIVQNIIATNTNDWVRWEIVSGTIEVLEKNSRLIGSVSQLVLERQGGPAGTRVLNSGSFNLPFLTGADARRMMYCYVATGMASPVRDGQVMVRRSPRARRGDSTAS